MLEWLILIVAIILLLIKETLQFDEEVYYGNSEDFL